MKEKLKNQLIEIKNWAFPVTGMIFSLIIPVAGLFFIVVGLIYAIFLFRQDKNRNLDLLIFNIIAMVLVMIISGISIYLAYQQLQESSSALIG